MLSMIVAKAKNNAIGIDNKLPWHISEDLKRFKDITTGNTIIMGRKTFESLPKILPNRHHVILTRDKNYKIDSDQVTIVHSIEEVINTYEKTEGEAFIIGGGEIYNSLLPYCKNLYLTEVNKEVEGDTFFPKINYNEWTISFESEEKLNPSDNISYKFVNLKKQE